MAKSKSKAFLKETTELIGRLANASHVLERVTPFEMDSEELFYGQHDLKVSLSRLRKLSATIRALGDLEVPRTREIQDVLDAAAKVLRWYEVDVLGQSITGQRHLLGVPSRASYVHTVVRDRTGRVLIVNRGGTPTGLYSEADECWSRGIGHDWRFGNTDRWEPTGTKAVLVPHWQDVTGLDVFRVCPRWTVLQLTTPMNTPIAQYGPFMTEEDAREMAVGTEMASLSEAFPECFIDTYYPGHTFRMDPRIWMDPDQVARAWDECNGGEERFPAHTPLVSAIGRQRYLDEKARRFCAKCDDHGPCQEHVAQALRETEGAGV